mmetsp:Transcript_5593/g.17656  ORF Transcript_5593/g.17656 Transcript_5593/m.17656 type:complete len:221 (-) Transcript_5593:4271-4933(-)
MTKAWFGRQTSSSMPWSGVAAPWEGVKARGVARPGVMAPCSGVAAPYMGVAVPLWIGVLDVKKGVSMRVKPCWVSTLFVSVDASSSVTASCVSTSLMCSFLTVIVLSRAMSSSVACVAVAFTTVPRRPLLFPRVTRTVFETSGSRCVRIASFEKRCVAPPPVVLLLNWFSVTVRVPRPMYAAASPAPPPDRAPATWTCLARASTKSSDAAARGCSHRKAL